jgi:hypothetical protein
MSRHNDHPCETGCEAADRLGFGLCAQHLDEWLRSPERRMLPFGHSDDQWHDALEQYITRKRHGRSLRAGGHQYVQ